MLHEIHEIDYFLKTYEFLWNLLITYLNIFSRSSSYFYAWNEIEHFLCYCLSCCFISIYYFWIKNKLR